MKRRRFSIDIQADKSIIWEAIWKDKSYRAWIDVFAKGSYVVCKDWSVGSTVHFLAPNKSGIYSRIEKFIPNEIIQFKHIGNVVNGIEEPIDSKSEVWTGASESYIIEEKENCNTLIVELDIMQEHLEFMEARFPQALEIVKVNALKAG